MAAFHFTAKIHSRSTGASAVGAAAYRAATRLLDERIGRVQDYTRKRGVIETAILAPAGAPDWAQERGDLWNRVEARERRKDAQLAQEYEINLPRELSDEENWRLVTDFARVHLVAEGRVCDMAFHRGIASDGEAHPHCHILMPLRQLDANGFGEKHPDCDWRTFTKRRDRLQELRAAWCDMARERAAELGYDLGPTWDHRSFEARGIDLEPQDKQGPKASRLQREGQPAERTALLLDLQRRNGAQLLINPEAAFTALTQRHSTFSHTDLARYVFQHSAQEQYPAIMAKDQAKLIEVGRDENNQPRFSTREMIALEREMIAVAHGLAGETRHRVRPVHLAPLERSGLSQEQRDAATYLLEQGDIACLIGYAGAGKSTLLNEARQAWEAAGYTVRGAALSGIAAEGLERGSGIRAATIARLKYDWENGRERLGRKDVLVIDEAAMAGSRDLARLVREARDAGSKVVLVGDPEQLQAIDAGAAFRAIAERVGAAELTEVRRQKEVWQQQATRELATGRTAAALKRYGDAGMIEAVNTDIDAYARLVERWRAGRADAPHHSRIMLAHRNEDVRSLNEVARNALRDAGALGAADVELETTRGAKRFAAGDRLLFRRNQRGLDVRNGTLGTIERVSPTRLAVRTDDGRLVELDPTVYRDIDHGYAVTVHKAQGITVDESYVLASRGFDRHLSYVAMSRHRERVTMVHSRDAFANDRELTALLRRERLKDTTLDYSVADMPVVNSPVQQRQPTIAEEAQFSVALVKQPSVTLNVQASVAAPAQDPDRALLEDNQPRVVKSAPTRPSDEITDAYAVWGSQDQEPKRPHSDRTTDNTEDMLKHWGDQTATPERTHGRQIKLNRGPER